MNILMKLCKWYLSVGIRIESAIFSALFGAELVRTSGTEAVGVITLEERELTLITAPELNSYLSTDSSEAGDIDKPRFSELNVNFLTT